MNHEVDHKDDDYDNHNDLGDGDSEDDHLEPQQPKKMPLLWYLIVFTLAMINLVFQHLPQHFLEPHLFVLAIVNYLSPNHECVHWPFHMDPLLLHPMVNKFPSMIIYSQNGLVSVTPRLFCIFPKVCKHLGCFANIRKHVTPRRFCKW